MTIIAMVLISHNFEGKSRDPIIYGEYEVSDNKGKEVIFEVVKGDYGSEIAKKLEDNGIIKSSKLFYELALADSRAKTISPGRYKLTQGVSSKQALDELLDSSRLIDKLIIKEGMRLSEIITLLEDSGYSDAYVVARSTKIPKYFGLNSLEGFLYPATYSFDSGISTEEVYAQMIRGFESVFFDEVKNRENNFSNSDILIIASIIQAEGTPDVFGKIAAVIYNRLKIDMPLQMDSTILYAEKSRGEIYLPLKSLEIESGYNTYKNIGLPIAPISNPGREAMHAAVNPEKGDWLYFVTVEPNDTRFAKNYKDFLKLKRLYQNNYKEGKFN
jgi:UPF0755 protein